MKKLVSLLLSAIALMSILSLTSCSSAEIDLRGKDNIYTDLADFISYPDEYKGKSVALTANCVAVYNFSTNKIARYSMCEIDESGEKRALYEIRTDDGQYPKTGSQVTVFGTFSGDGYINVERFNGAKYGKSYNIDALSFSATELKNFINNYREEYSSSDSYGKTIRIFGHLETVEKGYTFLVGLDQDGKYLWDIELYDPKGSFTYPTTDGDTVNPVEIIGELTTYTEKNVVYACIKVKQIGRAESVFKEDVVIK